MEQIWWKNIIKARKFWEDIVETAKEEKNILLTLPASVPWKRTLIDNVSEQLQMENPETKLEVIPCPEEDPGTFLLKNYCSEEIRVKYRYGISFAQFLGTCRETVLNNRYIWITDISADKYDAWVEFVTEYSKHAKNKTMGIFILEVHDDVITKKAKKGIHNIIFNQNISTYDKYAFCALVSSQTDCKEYLRSYLAELVASICGEDVELCAACVSSGIRFLENPYDIIQEIVEKSYRSDGKKYFFIKTKEEIDVCIWETQIKYIFPLIENYRRYFILKYNKGIKAALPINNGYGEVINEPEDAEIGTLLYLVEKGNITISEKENEALRNYRTARNRLAHMKLLNNENVEVMLKAGKHV